MSPAAIDKVGSLLPLAEDSILDATGKVFVITGGGSGVGLATVRLLETKNAAGIVILDYRKPADDILHSLSKTTIFVQADVTSWKSLQNAFQSAIDTFGRIDGVYANAGIGELDHLFIDNVDETTGELREPNYAAVDVNLKGVLSTVKLAVHWFRKLQVPGKIVMTSSMSGYETPGIPIYTSSKHGVIGILRAANLDLYDNYKICLNVVSPGPIDTNLINSFAGKKRTKYDELSQGYQFETQQADKPGIAAAYLLTTEQHGKSILVHGGRYRDAEGVYDAMRDDLLGGELNIPPASDIGWRNLFRCAFD